MAVVFFLDPSTEKKSVFAHVRTSLYLGAFISFFIELKQCD